MADKYSERRRTRAMTVHMAAQTIRQRVGKLEVEEAHVATLAVIAEMKGLWQCLLDRQLVNEEQRQTYLDRGAQALLQQVQEQGMQIDVVDRMPGRAS